MDPGQDLLLAALSESGICPNDFFEVDPQDVIPTPSSQQSLSINALGIGLGNEAPGVPPSPTVTIREKPQPSTTTFVLNQLNQLPSLGTIVVTKPSAGTASRQTITVTKVVHTSHAAQLSSSSSSSICAPSNDQIRLKDLLRPGSLKTSSSLGELMKLKPPPDIAQPVATATATGTSECWQTCWTLSYCRCLLFVRVCRCSCRLDSTRFYWPPFRFCWFHI